MKTKDQIIDDARRDITNTNYRDVAPLWLEVRKIEVLIDIRDILNEILIAHKIISGGVGR